MEDGENIHALFPMISSPNVLQEARFPSGVSSSSGSRAGSGAGSGSGSGSPRYEGMSGLQSVNSKEDEFAVSSDSDIGSLSSFPYEFENSAGNGGKANTGAKEINDADSDFDYDDSIMGASRSGFSSSTTTSTPIMLTPKSPARNVSNNNNNSNTSSPRSRSKSSKRRPSRSREELPPVAKVFKNLLILEESLRQQVAQQRSLRNNYLAFLTVLLSFLTISLYKLYFSLVEPTGYLKFFYRFISVISFVTLSLYYISGDYHRTIVLPKKFLSSTNKGLRQLNVRLIKVKTPLSDKYTDLFRYSLKILSSFLKWLLNLTGPLKNFKIGKFFEKIILSIENRSQPRVGATEVKLVLNPRIFNTHTRENWEMYRNEFWSREGARRRGAKSFNTLNNPEENFKNELIDKDKRERKERRKSKLLLQ